MSREFEPKPDQVVETAGGRFAIVRAARDGSLVCDTGFGHPREIDNSAMPVEGDEEELDAIRTEVNEDRQRTNEMWAEYVKLVFYP